MSTIELEHVGPVQELTIPVPEEGGVIVLRGRNGTGKSHALAGVESLYSRSARKGLRNSDGTPSGKISGLGVTVRLGRSNTIKGELVCESLDGRVDPSMLVDPGLKDPVSADAKRLETLVRLAGIQVTKDRWKEAIGEHDIDLTQVDADDPVASAARLERELHDLARKRERGAESKQKESDLLASEIKDVDLSAECDESVLAEKLAETTEQLATAKERRADAEANQKRTADAQRLLQENEAKALNVEACQSDVTALSDKVTAANQQREELQRQLNATETELAQLEVQEQAAITKLETAKAQQKQLSEWRSLVEQQTSEDSVTDDQLAELEAAKQAAMRALQLGEVVRRAKAQDVRRRDLAEKAVLEAKAAKEFRNLARSTDEVLEQALIDAGFDQIKVYEGRLCVDSDRGLEPFSELSHGERWRLALDLAARGLPKGAVLPVCQEAFESLDPENRKFVQSIAKELGLVILTAEASDGDLRAEML